MLVCLHVCACASVGHRTSLRPLRSLWSSAGCSLLFVSLNCLSLCVCSSPGYVLTVGVSGYQTLLFCVCGSLIHLSLGPSGSHSVGCVFLYVHLSTYLLP